MDLQGVAVLVNRRPEERVRAAIRQIPQAAPGFVGHLSQPGAIAKLTGEHPDGDIRIKQHGHLLSQTAF
jgi:hypothetical protein